MLLYTTFTIECAHSISAALGKTEIHGHSYWISLYVNSSVKEPYPLDALQSLAFLIKTEMDHKLLNDMIKGDPTTEAIIEYVLSKWPSDAPPLQKVIARRDSLNTGVEWTAKDAA